MTAPGSALESARAVADAVLFEGYVLYPYRASSSKNQVRWQWGVLMPADAVAADPSERATCCTGVVLDGRDPTLRLTVRFLQVQRRYVEGPDGERVERLEAGDVAYVPWDEARETEATLEVPLPDGLTTTLDVPGGTTTEELPAGVGRLVRVREPLRVRVEVTAERPSSPYPVTLVTARVTNATGPPRVAESRRPAWLRRALVACHLLLETADASFVSLLDPPEWASGFVGACVNEGVFPVLAGPPGQGRVVLSSPIILYDHPELAPQSESSFFDALEIDELLSLRTMTLSEAERREVRGTDPRVAALLREVDDMPPELWERLHGTVRYVDAMTGSATPSPDELVPWWDPGADRSVDPGTGAVRIGSVDVRRGSRVLLRPGARGADVHDLFLAGRSATVAAVLHDVDGKQHLAVTVDDDPGADLKLAHGRFLYFAPDEVEPLEVR
ncbi:hypothetical protein ACT8ZV_05410 [Nocardioides sp. MAHUQ-72]|uniref:hypothetical protein n=1 Tax=unclassified Nocardioides TaxID=2615069 RepID=UPI00360773C7